MENLNMTNLREALCEAFFGEASEECLKHIIPLSGEWIMPTAQDGSEEASATTIGYQIRMIEPISTRMDKDELIFKNCKFHIRIWSVGPQAEEVLCKTLFWTENIAVQRIFERFLGKMIEGGENIYSQVYENPGFNPSLCWFRDIVIVSYMVYDTEAEVIDSWLIEGEPSIRIPPEYADEIAKEEEENGL
jgi:hypothetical protein